MQLSHGAIKKEYIDADDTYTIVPFLKIESNKVLNQQKADDDGKADKNDDESADSYARNIIESAKSEEQKIIKGAKLKSEEIKKQAYDKGLQKGYAEGLKKGKDDGMKKVEDIRKQADDVLEEAHRISREYIDSKKDEIVNLSLNIARKIIGYKCNLDDEVITKILNDSIKSCVAKRRLLIRVNPMDYALVDCKRDEISKTTGEKVIISLLRDSNIKRGGCRLESESSIVDADIDSQLERIKEAMLT